MPAYFSPAPSVAAIGRKVIASHHPHLRGTRVEYVFRSEASKKGGKAVLGTAQKITGVNALLSTADVVDDEAASSEGLEYFLITIARDLWEHLADWQRIALVDHELCHCKIDMDDDGYPVLNLVTHDVEEFSDIIERHGLWQPDLTRFIRRMGVEQLQLWAETLPDDPIDPASRDYARNDSLRNMAAGVGSGRGQVTLVADWETGEVIRSDEHDGDDTVTDTEAPEEDEPPFFT